VLVGLNGGYDTCMLLIVTELVGDHDACMTDDTSMTLEKTCSCHDLDQCPVDHVPGA